LPPQTCRFNLIPSVLLRRNRPSLTHPVGNRRAAIFGRQHR
jgi:hypothetical protein